MIDWELRAKRRADREAREAFRAAKGKEALSEHAKAQKAFHDNRERLKAERLAREAKEGSHKKRTSGPEGQGIARSPKK